MLFSVAIVKLPRLDDASPEETVIYGPVTLTGDDSSALALKVVSNATKAGNLPDGYDPHHMRVVGYRFDCLI